jgi:prepilin-type processing-associated H-X9-DG protein
MLRAVSAAVVSHSPSEKKTYFRDNKMIYACAADNRPALDFTSYINPSYMMNSQLYNSAGPSATKDGPSTKGGGRLLSIHDFNDLRYPLSRIAFMTDAGADNAVGDRPRIRGHGNRIGTNTDDYFGVDERHGRAANILFMDGSVRSYSSEELNRPYTDPGAVVWMPW